MSKLSERYPDAVHLPHPDIVLDDAALLKLLQPYLGWVLAEIDTASLDILICESVTPINTRPMHVVLLSGRAVNVWLRNASTKLNYGDAPSESP
jgi:hypothetical protein